MEQDKLDVSCIFSSCDDDQANTTLTGILCSDDEEDIEQKISIDTDKNSSPSSVNYADEERNLVRTAMRRNIIKNDHDGHEKWVSYNEVVERKKVVMRGMSSSSSSTTSCYYNNHHGSTTDHGDVRNNNKLVLKLDYEKIMKSWVNKGPLYICGNSGLDAPQPQTVPDIRDDDFFFPTSINGSTHDERDTGGNDGSWTVPQLEDDALRVAGSSAVVHNREASVQRYKEKRRNRLFAKTIRYEVRKLNAEKRPRIKGRFVKRD
ncbi:CCT motif family protein [Tanacetum coccineum]